MTLFEYADVINREIVIKRYPNQDRFICNFRDGEVKDNIDSGILSSAYGDSNTIFGAIEDYCSRIEGKVLVFDAAGPKRTVFNVPVKLLTK